jgi:hypothetical protein
MITMCFNDPPMTTEQIEKAGWTCTGQGLTTLYTIAKDDDEIPVVAPLNQIHRFPEAYFVYGLEELGLNIDPVVCDTTGMTWYDRKQPGHFVADMFGNDRYHYHAYLDPEGSH